MKLWLGLSLLFLSAVCAWGGETYLVVDLSGGVGAERFGVRYCDVAPDVSNDVCRTSELWLRLVPAGAFVMGSPVGELGRDVNEAQHMVTLSKPFYMGVFEVTQKQWELVLGRNPSQHKGDTRPVEHVTYDEIRGMVRGEHRAEVAEGSFMGVLRRKTGLAFDLPTEAQWEYACRAGTGSALNSGRDLCGVIECGNLAQVGRYRGNVGDGKGGFAEHTKVGSYAPNAWGLYDMHGNVYEWCLDWYEPELGTNAVVDPKGPLAGGDRVVRGGYYYVGAEFCRAGYRHFYDPGGAGYDGTGLRVSVERSNK